MSVSVSVCVCVCVCLSAIISSELHVRSLPNFRVNFTYGCGSVLLRQSSDMLCISGFVDDVISAHKPSFLDVAAADAQCTRSLGLGYKQCVVIPFAEQRTHGTTFRALKVTSQLATPGAASAVYDCLVYYCARQSQRLRQCRGTHYRKLFSVVTLLQFLSLG